MIYIPRSSGFAERCGQFECVDWEVQCTVKNGAEVGKSEWLAAGWDGTTFSHASMSQKDITQSLEF